MKTCITSSWGTRLETASLCPKILHWENRQRPLSFSGIYYQSVPLPISLVPFIPFKTINMNCILSWMYGGCSLTVSHGEPSRIIIILSPLTEQRHKHVEDGEDRGGRDGVWVKKKKKITWWWALPSSFRTGWQRGDRMTASSLQQTD